MALTQEQRAALPDTEFAVPAKRKLPIHDKVHVAMAWNASHQLELSDRYPAQRVILRKASLLGVDTNHWNLDPVAFSAMALEFPAAANESHPNKLPFKGVLTYLDEPSDKPLQGTNGRKVIVPEAVAREALPTLLGMAIDFTPDFDGHAPQRKIGLITAADIEGNTVTIAGFFYAADFPEEVELIQADKEKLGFSFEALSLMQSMKADPLVVAAMAFTGAAVLYKDKAAYMKTSLAARADQQETKMDKELQEALAALSTGVATLVTGFKDLPNTIGAAVGTALKQTQTEQLAAQVAAAKAQIPALRTSASALRTAGLVVQANEMDAQANLIEQYTNKGELPPASASPSVTNVAASGANKEVTDTLKVIADSVSSLATKVVDLTTKVDRVSASGGTGNGGTGSNGQPQRKTLADSNIATLKKIGIDVAASGDKKITVTEFDNAAQKAQLPSQQSLALKMAMNDAGLLTS